MRILLDSYPTVNPMKREFIAKVSAKRQLTTDIHELELTLQTPDRIDFDPGQFITVHIPKNGKIVTRAYSIASGPAGQNTILLCYKYLPEGTATNYFQRLEVGDTVKFDGPQGHFVLKDPKTPINFIVTGTGITPIMSMLEHMSSAAKVNLWFGLRSQPDIFWQDKLDEFKQKHNWFDYTICLSQPEDGWDGAVGRVTAHIAAITADPSGHFYVCGSPAMVIEMRKALLAQQIPAKNIFFEMFT